MGGTVRLCILTDRLVRPALPPWALWLAALLPRVAFKVEQA